MGGPEGLDGVLDGQVQRRGSGRHPHADALLAAKQTLGGKGRICAADGVQSWDVELFLQRCAMVGNLLPTGQVPSAILLRSVSVICLYLAVMADTPSSSARHSQRADNRVSR